VQQTFLKLWQYRASLNESFTIEQQVFHISRTVFIDYLRKENIKSRQGGSHPAKVCYINEEFDTKKQVYQVLDRMPAMRKKIFELNRIQGFSYQEIARILSISVKSVDNNLTKALRYLRKTMLFVALLLICLKFF